MQTSFEMTAFRENFKILTAQTGTCERDLLLQLLNEPDISSLPAHDNPLFNLLVKSLKSKNPYVQRSAKAYIAFRLMKKPGEEFRDHLLNFFDLEDDNSVFHHLWCLVEKCDRLDEEDFSFFCQAMSEYPLTDLNWRYFFGGKYHEKNKAGLNNIRIHILRG